MEKDEFKDGLDDYKLTEKDDLENLHTRVHQDRELFFHVQERVLHMRKAGLTLSAGRTARRRTKSIRKIWTTTTS
eukprot:12410495-Heterocapsa_arctica.AAC.1